MSRRMVCVLWVDSVAVEHHYFPLPTPDEPGFYRAVVSYNAYRERESTKFYDWCQKANRKIETYPRRGHADREEDMFMAQRCMPQELQDKLPKLPEFEHESIWAMYLAIGYDYKKKKYITKE